MLHTYFKYLQHAIAIANWQYELAIMIEHKADDDDNEDDDDDDGDDDLTGWQSLRHCSQAETIKLVSHIVIDT